MANQFNNIIRVGENTLGTDDFYETRIENDANGNPLYIWRSPIPNADPDDRVGFVTKLHYDGNGFLSRVQIPDDGQSFTYSYTDRASYFS